ncbi:MAG: sensor histidine kinase [Limnospira sp.]
MRKILNLIVPIILSLLAVLILAPTSYANLSDRTAVLTDSQKYYPWGANLEILADPGGKLAIDQALTSPLQTEGLIVGFYYGFIVITIAYHFFIWLKLRDKIYGYYVLFLLATAIANSSTNGLLNQYLQYLWPDFPEINNFFVLPAHCLFLLALIKFTATFLDSRVLTPNWNRFLRYSSWATIAMISVSFIAPFNIAILIFFGLLLIVYWGTFFTTLSAWIRGQKQARYFLFAQLFLLVLANLTIFSIVNLRPGEFQIWIAYPSLGILPTVFCMALALGDRIDLIKRQQEKERAEALLVKEQFNRALLQVKEDLERRVKIRTQELKKAKMIAEKANRSKSQLIANVSHELRTPLNGILGYAQILKRGDRLTEQQKEGLEVIYSCGSHLSSLIDEILDISQLDDEKIEIYPADFCLREVLNEVAESFREKLRKKQLDFVHIFDDTLPANLRADPQRLRQILNHLLDNASEYTRRGGIIFKVKLIQIFPAAPPDLDSAKINFSIEDTGGGLTSEQIGQLFQPFECFGDRVHNTEGTGLGLTISQRLVQIMGGNIQVESDPDRGSKFWFDLTLPISTAELSPFPARQILKNEESTPEPSATETPLILPPIEELSALIKAARIGDIETLEREAKRLKQINSSYTNFANKVLQFARDFDDRAILNLIEVRDINLESCVASEPRSD